MAESKKKKNAKKEGWAITFNAPATLSFIIACLLVFLLQFTVSDAENIKNIFSCYATSFSDPMQYLRLFTHVIGHVSWDHLFSNALYILIIAPMMEEKYGSLRLLILILITAFSTGLVLIIFTPEVQMMGASGVVFAVVILASCANLTEKRIPVTLILVLVCYVGQEILLIQENDGIAHAAHIIGGVCGGVYGIFLANRKKPKEAPPKPPTPSMSYQSYIDKYDVK